jgi:hypothetical protein
VKYIRKVAMPVFSLSVIPVVISNADLKPEKRNSEIIYFIIYLRRIYTVFHVEYAIQICKNKQNKNTLTNITEMLSHSSHVLDIEQQM